MTRVALLPSAYPPSVGGVEELSRHLALTLRDAGDEVEVWTSHLDQPRRGGVMRGRTASSSAGSPCRCPAARPQSWPPVVTDGRRTLVDLRAAAEAFRPDVLHVQCFGPNGVYATALSRWLGIPLVVSLQGETVMDDADIFEQSHTMRAALRAGFRQASAVTGCSRFTLNDAARFGLPEAPARSSSTASRWTSRYPPHRASGDPRYVLGIGRVVDKKGFDLLIRGFARIAERHPDVELRIGGSGPALAELTALVDATGLGAPGAVPRPAGPRRGRGLMAGADCVAMPSRLEPFGIVVLEGWRAGTPVALHVVRRTARVRRRRCHRPAGGSLRHRCRGDRTRPACSATRPYASPSGPRARARCESFGWPQITEQYRRIYESVCAARAAASVPARRVDV